MLWRHCGLCSWRIGKINIVLGVRGENVTKTLQNWISLPSVSTLLSPIVATPTPFIKFISNHAYYQYFLQALTPAPTFTLKLLVLTVTWKSDKAVNSIWYDCDLCWKKPSHNFNIFLLSKLQDATRQHILTCIYNTARQTSSINGISTTASHSCCLPFKSVLKFRG